MRGGGRGMRCTGLQRLGGRGQCTGAGLLTRGCAAVQEAVKGVIGVDLLQISLI